MTISQLLSLFSRDVDPGIRAVSLCISCCVYQEVKKCLTAARPGQKKASNPVGAGRPPRSLQLSHPLRTLS